MWEHLVPYLETTLREILAKQDARNPQNDFADGLVATDAGGVTLGTLAKPTGRTVSVATLVDRIDNDGKAEDQRFLPQVSAGNRLSAQSVAPLTSTGSASTAEIAIAAHTVQYGFGTVSYSAGSITGLTPLTLYFIYADDTDYEGGAVAYTATTSQQTVTASNGRYYVGAITAANSTPSGTINAATSANPIEFTTAAVHGLSSGNTVTLAGLPGDFGTNLNGNDYVITVTTTTKFTIAIDGSGYAAYTTGGTATRVSTATTGSPGGGWDFDYNTP